MPPTTAKHMEANMQKCTSPILSIFDDILNNEICYQLAKQHKFIQRDSSKIRGHEFVKALVLPSQGVLEDSLNGLCERMRHFNPQANITASALAQRINQKSAERYIRAVFEKFLQKTREKLERSNSSLRGALKNFNNVLMQDSTVFEINKHLCRFFPGTKRGGTKGGSSCKSQIKIDLIHNFATGQIVDATIHKGKLPDQALSDKIVQKLNVGDLVLRDLGYFKIEALKTIMARGAFFITRFPPHVKVYLNPNDEKSVSLALHINKNYKKSSIIDLKVWISDERLEVRMIVYRLPKDIVEKRRRKANKSAKEMGRTTSKEKHALLDFSIFVCNIPIEMISAETIGTIYRLRWEIELIFKIWKSQLKIDLLEGVRYQRIQCLVWSRLCMVVIVAHITAGFFDVAEKFCKGELSPTKLVDYLLRNNCLCQAIRDETLKEFERQITQDIPKRLLKEKRTRTTMRQRSINSEPYYEWCCVA
jgi:hypothetical protein